MRIKSVGVTGLFGTFNHEFDLQNEEKVTIIHGPNGFGKTVMLKMIAAVILKETAIFEHMPFAEFSMTLEDGSKALIRRRIQEEPETKKPKAVLEFSTVDAAGQSTSISPSGPPPNLPRSVMEAVDRLVPGPYRIHGTGWADQLGRQFTLSDILLKFPKAAEALPREYRPAVIFEMLSDQAVFFVETNRLDADPSALARRQQLDRAAYLTHNIAFNEPPPVPVPRVKQYSDDVVQRVQTVLADYARHSQERDRSFPERLVLSSREQRKSLPEREILSQIAELEKKRQRLISLGFLDSETGLRDLTEDDVRRVGEALSIYVEDVQEKLKVFDDMARRIGTLVDIINSRFEYKRLRLDRRRGFRIVSNLSQNIQLEDLSSGEQHELVLLYELLFRTPKNALVLVDEPEISLHVGWQTRFLSDLIEIMGQLDAYAIVATHSPMIIGKRWDLAVELKGPETRS